MSIRRRYDPVFHNKIRGPLVEVPRQHLVDIGFRGRRLCISAFTGPRTVEWNREVVWVDARALKRYRRRALKGVV